MGVGAAKQAVRGASVRAEKGAVKAEEKGAVKAEEKVASKAEEKEGIFSRHGGKMVLGFLGGVGAWLYRGHLGNNNFELVRSQVEDSSPLDPHEVEDLRCSNDLPPHVLSKVQSHLWEEYPDGLITYPKFVEVVTRILPHPLENGHLLDRVVLGLESSDQSRAADSPRLHDLDLLLVCLSMAVNTTVEERVEQMWQLASRSGGDEGELPRELPASAVSKLISLLLQSQQLPAGKQVVKTDHKWPFQTYQVAQGEFVFNQPNLLTHMKTFFPYGWGICESCSCWAVYDYSLLYARIPIYLFICVLRVGVPSLVASMFMQELSNQPPPPAFLLYARTHHCEPITGHQVMHCG
ncbi:unnamed protein product, partial [Chrysoparadoxa australica]